MPGATVKRVVLTRLTSNLKINKTFIKNFLKNYELVQ
jgi:hypothetical protein